MDLPWRSRASETMRKGHLLQGKAYFAEWELPYGGETHKVGEKIVV